MNKFDSTKPKYAHLFQTITLLTNFLHRKHMDLTYKVVGDLITNPTTHGQAGFSSYKCKIVLTPNLNSFYVIKSNFLTTFKLLIVTLFNFSFLISTLQAMKASQIQKVVEMWDATITMFLNWLSGISNLVINFSPSLSNGVKSKMGQYMM